VGSFDGELRGELLNGESTFTLWELLNRAGFSGDSFS
jgi:hypothetical protein